MNTDSTKIRFEPSDDSDYVPETKEVRPIQGPKPTKDFKKVLSRTGRQGKDEEEELLQKVSSEEEGEEQTAALRGIKPKRSKVDEENDSDGPVSLFDLSKRAAQKEKEERQGSRQSKMPISHVEAPQHVATKNPTKELKLEETPPPISPEEPKKEKFTTRYTPEQPDISYVNPLAGLTSTQTIASPTPETKVEKPVPIGPALQEICAQLVKEMYKIEKKGQTDTVVILQHPPFKDVKIVVSSFDTAKGQFNIAFENLTQAAQTILDREENRKSLLSALEKRGYNVQILSTTTTITDSLPITDERASQSERDRNRDQEQEGQQDRPRQDRDMDWDET